MSVATRQCAGKVRAGLWAGKRAHARLSKALCRRMESSVTMLDPASPDSRNEGVPSSNLGVGFKLRVVLKGRV